MKKELTVRLTPLFFYARRDEYCFFNWLKKMPFILGIKRFGDELQVKILSNISRKSTWKLLGFFSRYRLNPEYLIVLINENNKDLIEDFLAKKLFTGSRMFLKKGD